MTQTEIPIQQGPAVGPWESAVIPTPEFPLETALAARLVKFIDGVSALASGRALQPTGMLQYNQLKFGRAGYIMAENGPRWRIEWGLGYWPDRPPPTLWTAEEWHSLGIGEMPRPLMHQIFVLSDPALIGEARSALMHSGCWAELYSRVPVADIKKTGTAQFQPLITEMSLKCFPFYLPVFSGAILQPAFAAKLDEWSCGVEVFLRQSPEDKGLFIAARGCLRDVLEAGGAKFRRVDTNTGGSIESKAHWFLPG